MAVSTLQKLGEDIEACLKQLLFGTVSRSMRRQLAEEVKKFEFIRSYELAILDRISLIEVTVIGAVDTSKPRCLVVAHNFIELTWISFTCMTENLPVQ